MQLTLKQLKNLPVYTKDNDYLGKIEDMEINSQTQNVSLYIIKSSQLAERLAVKKLLIAANQVISLDDNKMVVEDGIIREVKESLAKNFVGV